MAILLYKHNQDACDAIERMLQCGNRTAVVHPTGTGKSMIVFRFAQLHAAQGFLWLSPSDYIARTQLENAQAADPDADFSHITFMTYARLMHMDAAEMARLKPDYIVLDEFHRCGADVWGESVQRLLELYPQVKVIGLSATKIRYLDHQRDMAEELFHDRIASEITLGEAIVRDILPAPVYVTTIYQYQKSLEKYEERIQRLQRRKSRERSERYLQTLRRALEQAEGLNGVFARHVTEREGRYILFCSSVSHMKEVHARIHDWFGSIDPEPHCYLVYAENAESDQAYAAFCQDGSHHLKLLLCVNMLNEGIHVKGLSGVILFRPTTSPIIYKQQIGRALTAGNNRIPLILDVVNNVESLYSISSIQQEMFTAASRLREQGLEELIIREKFEVIDQVQDCRKLFEQLEGSLHIDWEEYYQAAAQYRQENGHLMIPQRYVTPDGKCLGSWLQAQRSIRHESKAGKLTEVQIARLDQLGIVWENQKDLAWEGYYQAAESWFRQHGHLTVPVDYVTKDGKRLGVWLNNMRARYAALAPEERSEAVQSRIHRMNQIGMVWDTYDARWEQYFQAAQVYTQENGHLRVPVNYQTPEGLALGVWINNQRSKYKGQRACRLTDVQISRLESIGMVWSITDATWMQYYTAAKTYYENNGDLKVAKRYITGDGLKLGAWLVNQRSLYRKGMKQKGNLNPERIHLLTNIGMTW